MLDPFLVVITVITVIMSAQKNVGPFFSSDHSDHSDHECSSVLMSSYRSCTFFATDHSDHRDHECSEKMDPFLVLITVITVIMSAQKNVGPFFSSDHSDHSDHECSEKCWTLF
jgi:hypothetical protein